MQKSPVICKRAELSALYRGICRKVKNIGPKKVLESRFIGVGPFHTQPL